MNKYIGDDSQTLTIRYENLYDSQYMYMYNYTQIIMILAKVAHFSRNTKSNIYDDIYDIYNNYAIYKMCWSVED